MKYNVAVLYCQAPIHSLLNCFFQEFIDWIYNAHTSHFKMVACRKINNQNKSLGMNYIQIIIEFELQMLTQVEENSYLRLILLDS